MSTCTNSSMASPHAATVRDRPVTEDQIESDNTRRVSDDNMLSPEVRNPDCFENEHKV